MDTQDELDESNAASLVVKKTKRSLSEEDQAIKDRHDALLKRHNEKTNFSGIELKRNSMRTNVVQAYRNASAYHKKIVLSKASGKLLSLVEAAYSHDIAIDVLWLLDGSSRLNNMTHPELLALLQRLKVNPPCFSVFETSSAYPRLLHEFAGSFTRRQSLNFFSLEELNKAWRREARKRSLDLAGDGISLVRRKELFVTVVDAIIKKWK
jgi:hypothetical protein